MGLCASQVSASRSGVRRLLCQDREAESGPFTNPAFHLDSAAHHLAQPLADCQPQTCASIAAGSGHINLAERLEQAVHPLCRNSNACISDGKLDDMVFFCFWRGARTRGSLAGNRDDDFSLICEFHRVGEQVDENLPQSGNVSNQTRRDIILYGVCQVELFRCRPRGYQVHCAFDAFAQVEWVKLQFHFPRPRSWKNPECH